MEFSVKAQLLLMTTVLQISKEKSLVGYTKIQNHLKLPFSVVSEDGNKIGAKK